MTGRPVAALLVCATVLLSCGPVGAADILPPAQPTAAPVQGDLTHINFTATAPTSATLDSPVPGGFGGDATPFIVSTGPGAGVELSVNGVVVDPSHIGKRDVVRTTGETRYTFFGVGLLPGPNTIVLTPLGADGRRFSPSRYTVFGRGPAVAIHMKIDGRVIADGRTVRTLRINGIDRWGNPAMAGVGFEAVVRSGDVRLGGSVAEPSATGAPAAGSTSDPVPAATLAAPDAGGSPGPSGFNPQNSNPQIGIATSGSYRAIADADGGANIPILPGLRAGDAVIDVSVNDGSMTFEDHFYVWPYLRRPILTGLVTGGVGAVPGDPGSDASAPYEANSRAGRVALYGTGAVGSIVSVAAGYDTAGALDENATTGSFNEDPNARPYLTYGDSSQRRADALSTTHLYAHVDDGPSSVSFGEFEAKTTDDTGSSLGGFDLLMNGARLDLANNGEKLEVFRANAGVSYGRQVIAPNGLASTNYYLHPDVVVGSESLTLVTLDRHLGFIISETGLTRNVDYVIDYGTGTLRFINAPLAYDEQFDPQQILVQYEYLGNGGAVATGGRATAKLGALAFGLGYADDSTGSGNLSLFNQSIAGTTGAVKFRLDHLSTAGGIGNEIPTEGESIAPAPTTAGNAYRGSLTGGFGSIRYDGVYETTTAGFNDPFGGLATPGLTSMRLSLTDPIPKGDVAFAFDSELNALSGSRSSDSSATLRVHRTFGKKLKTTVALIHRVTSTNGVTAPTGFLSAGQSVNATDPIVPVPVSSASGTASVASAGAVTQAEAGATYALSPAVSASLDRISDIGGAPLASLSNPAQTTAQVTATFGKGQTAYVRELWTDSATQTFALASQGLASAATAQHVLQVGLERAIGSATTIDTQYSLQNTGNGSDIYSAIGVKQHVFASKTFAGDVTVQRANAAGQGGGGFDLYGLSLSYNPSSAFRATSQYQLRTGQTPGSTLQLGAAGYLGGGVSLVASVNDTRALDLATDDERVALAFRPQNDDRSSVLLGFDHLIGVGDVEGERTDIASLDGLHRFTPSTEVTARLGYQMDGDQYYPAHSSIGALRVLQRLGPRIDVAGEVRGSTVSGVADSSETGYAAELGYRIGDVFRLAGGYNFAQTPDLSLAAPPRRKGFYITATSIVTSLLGFGKDAK